MSSTPTKNAVPSESYDDLRYNAGVLDAFLNSQDDTFRDRFGSEKETLKRITVNAASSQQIEEAKDLSQEASDSAASSALSAASSANAASNSASLASSSANSAQSSATNAADSAALAASPSGITDGSSAGSGKVGQIITGTSGPTAIANATVVNAASITLTPGEWEVNAVLSIATSGGATTAVVQTSISNQSLTFATFPNRVMRGGPSTYATELLCRRRFNVTTNTTIYLTGYAEYSGGSPTVSGYLEARRTR